MGEPAYALLVAYCDDFDGRPSRLLRHAADPTAGIGASS